MTIQNIRDYLENNPQYFSHKNQCKPKDISSGKRYYFVSSCGHEFYAYPKNVIRDWRVGCPVCSGMIIINGVNDFNTIHPELSKYLSNIDDGYNYSASSNKNVEWTCPYCGHKWIQSFNKMVNKVNKCANCGLNNSYSERIMSGLLCELCEPYEREVIFDWSNNKRYDFYLPLHNMIIEMHGKQHYSNSFSYSSTKRNLYTEEENDDKKQSAAIRNGISEYVIIDASKTNFDWIKTNICESILPTILDFSAKDIDWDYIDKYAVNSLIHLVCIDYKNGSHINELMTKYHKSRNAILNYLKKGVKFGWCNYNPDEAKRLNNIHNGERIIKNMSKPVLQLNKCNDEIINEFPSIQEAQIQLKISHIWDCVVGKRKSAGGYKWRYKQ